MNGPHWGYFSAAVLIGGILASMPIAGEPLVWVKEVRPMLWMHP
jgi:hypothetical protein